MVTCYLEQFKLGIYPLDSLGWSFLLTAPLSKKICSDYFDKVTIITNQKELDAFLSSQKSVSLLETFFFILLQLKSSRPTFQLGTVKVFLAFPWAVKLSFD